MNPSEVQPHPRVVDEAILTLEPFAPGLSHDPLRVLKLSLDFPYSSTEWDAIFIAFILLLPHEDEDDYIWQRAMIGLEIAIEIEASQVSNCQEYQPKLVTDRLWSIFKTISAMTIATPVLFDRFCARLSFLKETPIHHQLVLQWLNQLAASNDDAHHALDPEEILAAQIFFGAYDSSWKEQGPTLLELLDSPNLNLRACAAGQIGRFYRQAIAPMPAEGAEAQQTVSSIDLPPLNTMLQLMRDKELEHPGVGGAFWHEGPQDGDDAKEWLLSILEASLDPEPIIHYYRQNLACHAMSRFDGDAEAVRRLIDVGRTKMAAYAATSDFHRNVAMEPLLLELSQIQNPEYTKILSWHLARYYQMLYSPGVELGYVERIKDMPEVDFFIIYDEPWASLRSITLYPKGKGETLSRTVAQSWVDRIFSEVVRGQVRGENVSLVPQKRWCERGEVHYHPSLGHPDGDRLDSVILWYRCAEIPWTIEQFRQDLSQSRAS